MFRLIPRVIVNYTIRDLLRGLVSGRGQGAKCERLRKSISQYFNIEDVLLTSSGRASIYMLLRYLPQSKVVIPAYTCKVVVEAAMMAGKKVIYAPTSRKTFNISSLPELDSDSIVIATHQYGLPCDIENICAECQKRGAVVIEDCAASLGTKTNGKLTGLFGDFAIFSFDSSKLITAPSKGGFIIAKNSKELSQISATTPQPETCSASYKIKHLLRGLIYVLLKSPFIYRCFHYLTMERKGQMQLEDHSGLNLTLSEFYTHGLYDWQAVIALRQFEKINNIIAKRELIYSRYNKGIVSRMIEKPPFVRDSACIRYSILVKDKKDFYNKCVRGGVDMGFSFNSIVCPQAWAEEHSISEDVLNVPFYYNLKEKEQSRIIKTINSIRLV